MYLEKKKEYIGGGRSLINKLKSYIRIFNPIYKRLFPGWIYQNLLKEVSI